MIRYFVAPPSNGIPPIIGKIVTSTSLYKIYHTCKIETELPPLKSHFLEEFFLLKECSSATEFIRLIRELHMDAYTQIETWFLSFLQGELTKEVESHVGSTTKD